MEYGKGMEVRKKSVKQAAAQFHIKAVYIFKEEPSSENHIENDIALLIEMENQAGLSDYFRFCEEIKCNVPDHVKFYTTGIGEGIKLKGQPDRLFCIYRKGMDTI